MHHYIAFIWDKCNRAIGDHVAALSGRLTRDARWTLQMHGDGLVLYDRQIERERSRAYKLSRESGVILGRLFPAEMEGWTPDHQPLFDERTSGEIVASTGKQLVENYWGSYISFLRDADNAKIHVMRDCSGGIPCYRTHHKGIQIVFADIGDLRPLLLPSFTINWKYMSAFLYYEQLQIRQCGLTEITEVLAGESVSFGSGEPQQLTMWDPRKVCRSPPIEEHHFALSTLADVTEQCVDAWGSVYSNILHSLSGGFDSAVVLGLLKRAMVQPMITCVNRYNLAAGEDERSFARQAASRADVRLIECNTYAGNPLFDTRLFTSPLCPKPTIPLVCGAIGFDVLNGIAEAHNADVIWTGQGGDHLFLYQPFPFLAADFFRDHGLRPGFHRAIADAARVSRQSYWSALSFAISSDSDDRSFIAEDLKNRKSYFTEGNPPVDVLDYITHPWQVPDGDIPIGKHHQISSLAELTNRHRSAGDYLFADECHPLISQPLIEVCLRIPTYVLQRGGRVRALARDAFRPHVPQEIVDRETKGGTTAFWMDVFRRSRPFLQELFFDGLLVREGILNKRALDACLSGSQPMQFEQFPRLLACIAAEVWTRSWMTQSLSATPSESVLQI